MKVIQKDSLPNGIEYFIELKRIMKRFLASIFLTFLTFSTFSQNLAEAVFKCDLSTVQKYVEKLDADLNKRPENQYIDNVENPTYLFRSVYYKNEGTDLEKRGVAKYLLEHGAKIDADSLFYVLENDEYEMLWILWNYGKITADWRITLGNLDSDHSPINSAISFFGRLGNENFDKEKAELSKRRWTLLDYYQSPFFHKWEASYSYDTQRDFYNGVYSQSMWFNSQETDRFYMMEELCRISGTEKYEECNHTVWLIAENLEHVKKYLREGGAFHKIDYMAMNLLHNEELISFLKDLDFYQPCNIHTKQLGPFSLWILETYFNDKIDENTIQFLNAVYKERVYGVSDKLTEKIMSCLDKGLDLHKALDNFSKATPFIFAAMYASPETLNMILNSDTSFYNFYKLNYSDEIIFDEEHYKCPKDNIKILEDKRKCKN